MLYILGAYNYTFVDSITFGGVILTVRKPKPSLTGRVTQLSSPLATRPSGLLPSEDPGTSEPSNPPKYIATVI